MEKYYTPKIEDLRVGYECEMNYPVMSDIFSLQTITKEDLGFHITMLGGQSYRYRTPYLTKEQIEAEGWLCYEKETSYHENTGQPWRFKFCKGVYECSYRIDIHLLTVTVKAGMVSLYYGDCPSINEFRQITKLLGI